MANEQAKVKLRLDIDYPYPSRMKSFLYVALGIKNRKARDYLKNARIIARMINESPRQVMAYWFFTPYTIPDKAMLDLLNPERHEVCLHVVNDPYREWKTLEKETKRTVNYYSIHGTSRLLGQLVWRRKIGQRQAKIPADFPLKSFHDFPTISLDFKCYELGTEKAKREIENVVSQNNVLSTHPDWLFRESERNRRGPCYDVLKYILGVDRYLEDLQIKKKIFCSIARDSHEYERNATPNDALLQKLVERNIDIFTFLERRWCCPTVDPKKSWAKADDYIGLLEIKDYQSWLTNVGKKTRNMIKRAAKSAVSVDAAEANGNLFEGIWKIYNETPIRQERAFSHYGDSLETVTRNMTAAAADSTFIGASLDQELVGFIQIIKGDNISIISQILSMQKHWDKAINNALLAKTVEVCASKEEKWLMYGRMGNHPSLDRFKESNGFVKYPVARYYIPLTWRGKVAVRLGLHRDLKDALPASLKYPLIPVMNWASRNRVKFKNLF